MSYKPAGYIGLDRDNKVAYIGPHKPTVQCLSGSDTAAPISSESWKDLDTKANVLVRSGFKVIFVGALAVLVLMACAFINLPFVLAH